MKKLFSFILVAFFTATLFGQTIVPTEPSNRNVIIEEFTGKTCQFCPDGHKRVHELMLANPGRVWGINVHQGGYASGVPNYTTAFGNALWNGAAGSGTGLGYPAGTVNREAVDGQALMGSGSNYMFDRGKFAPCTNIIKEQPSCVNVAATGTIDLTTRKLTLLVEVYYTGNAVQTTNKLTIALLQSNIIGPQTGASAFPEMVVPGGLYRHNHMLRHFLTGQWGAEVTPTTAGSFWSHTYEYIIPEDLNNIPILLQDLDVLVYIAETNKDIISGNHANVTNINPPALQARIDAIEQNISADCYGDANLTLNVTNSGTDAITSVEITYSIAGEATQTMTWNARTIAPMGKDTIVLPRFNFPLNVNKVVKVKFTKINEVDFLGNEKSITLNKAMKIGTPAKFVLGCDRYASETRFKIYNPDGSIFLQGGPWADAGANGVTVKEFDFITTQNGCYVIEVTDSFGDGINAGYGAGYFRVLDASANIIASHNGVFTTIATLNIGVGVEYSVNATANTNGAIVPSGNRDYFEGASPIYYFVPAAGYIVDQVLVNGVAIESPGTSYSFSDLQSNQTIEVTFKVFIGITDVNGIAISVTPNPVRDVMYINGSYDKLDIISISGQILGRANGDAQVSVANLPKGIYFVRVQTNGQTHTFKVVK